jgi:metal-sulfur cluster biosynthetic enzyme
MNLNCFFTTIISALVFLNNKSINSFTFRKSSSYRIRNHQIAIGDRKDCPILFKEAHHLCKLVPTNADSLVDIVQERKVEVISVLRNVIDPEAGTDIIESGWISINTDVNSIPEFNISGEGNVSLTMSLPSDYGSDIYEEIKKICILEISMLDWVNDIKITFPEYLPIINKLVNKYLASLDFFVNFNLDESFKETIKSRHRDEFTYASFSEGEKQKIDLALLFSWRAVAKLKNSANTNLLILDEVFDSSLDANGTEYLMTILQMLEGTNVFVISHKGDILQDKFRSVIRFEKIKNFSRIMK